MQLTNNLIDHLSMARLRDQFNSQDKIPKALADADYAGRRIRHSCHFEAAAEEIGMSRIDGGIPMVWILATAKGRARIWKA
jgi:hypothetical protein